MEGISIFELTVIIGRFSNVNTGLLDLFETPENIAKVLKVP